MSEQVFVIRNQLGQFWARSGEWVDGREPQRLLKLKHHDEAVNQLVELSARDIDLRGEVAPCEVNERKEPQVTVSDHLTPTQAEQAAEAARREAANQEGDAPEPVAEPAATAAV